MTLSFIKKTLVSSSFIISILFVTSNSFLSNAYAMNVSTNKEAVQAKKSPENNLKRKNSVFIKGAVSLNFLVGDYNYIYKKSTYENLNNIIKLQSTNITDENLKDSNFTNLFGAEVSFDYFIEENLSIGLDLTWFNNMKEHHNSQSFLSKGTETETQNIELELIPINFVAKLYLTPIKNMSDHVLDRWGLYIGGGVGYNHIIQESVPLKVSQLNTQLQAGINLWLMKDLAVTVSAKKYFNVEATNILISDNTPVTINNLALNQTVDTYEETTVIKYNPFILTLGITYDF